MNNKFDFTPLYGCKFSDLSEENQKIVSALCPEFPNPDTYIQGRDSQEEVLRFVGEGIRPNSLIFSFKFNTPQPTGSWFGCFSGLPK